MPQITAFLGNLPAWLFWLGWGLLFASLLLRSKTTAKVWSQVGINIGAGNSVAQTQVNQADGKADAQAADTPLAKCAHWAQIFGLAITLVGLFKDAPK